MLLSSKLSDHKSKLPEKLANLEERVIFIDGNFERVDDDELKQRFLDSPLEAFNGRSPYVLMEYLFDLYLNRLIYFPDFNIDVSPVKIFPDKCLFSHGYVLSHLGPGARYALRGEGNNKRKSSRLHLSDIDRLVFIKNGDANVLLAANTVSAKGENKFRSPSHLHRALPLVVPGEYNLMLAKILTIDLLYSHHDKVREYLERNESRISFVICEEMSAIVEYAKRVLATITQQSF